MLAAFAGNAPSAAAAPACTSGGSSFSSIQAAVNAASPSATIQCGPGTYSEAVTVNKSVTLLGPKAGVDARDPSRTGLPTSEAVVDGTANGGKTPFDVTANDVTIDGFTIQGASSTTQFGSNVLVGAGTSGETLQNNIIQNGISALQLGSSSSTIRRNLIQNNNLLGPLSGDGIYTDQFAAGGSLTADTVNDNSFVNDQNAGILLGSSSSSGTDSNFTISSNTFTGNGNGLFATYLTASTITGNVIAHSLGSQIALGDGVANDAVTQNVIQNGSTNGVRILNAFGGAAATGTTIACNSVSGNATNGLAVDAGGYAGSLDARLNWWGSATGPKIASNPGGSGQAISDPGGHVTFRPFLLDGTDSDPATPGFQCIPKLTVSDVRESEGGVFHFTVTLNNPSASPVTVGYATEDGTALAGVDYASTFGALSFASGELAKTVSVRSLEDRRDEPNGTFRLELVNPSGATIARGEGTGTILEDRDPPAIRAELAARVPLREALRKGLDVDVTSDVAGTATIAAASPHRNGRAHTVVVVARAKRLARGKATFTHAGTKRVVVKFTRNSRSRLASATKLKLTLNVTFTDVRGATASKAFRVTLRP